MFSFFVSGVPKLKRQELVAACEDFSNIIGSFSEGTIYKGTLSSGVEIAVTSTSVKSRKDWSKNLGAQFRKKVCNRVALVTYMQAIKIFWNNTFCCVSRSIHCQK